MNIDEITEARRDAIAQSIRPIDAEEMKTLGETLFPYLDDPWRERFFAFLAQNPHEPCHHATAGNDIQVLYCHAKKNGFWFVPGHAMGPLQARGLAILNEIVGG